MPDGAGHPGVPRSEPIMHEKPRRQGTTVAAALVAAGLHLAVLMPLLWLAPRAKPPEGMAAVEITPVPDASTTPPAPERPVTESTSSAAVPEPTRTVDTAPDTAAQPPLPDTAAPVPSAEPADPPPPLAPVQPAQPEPVTAEAQPPEPAQTLTSNEPPLTEAPAELLHAEVPPPDAVVTEAPPMPVMPPPMPRPPQPPPPRQAARPTPPRREVAQATEPAMPAQPAPASPSAAPAAVPAIAPAALPSNVVPTWRGELVGRLQRAKRYPDSARSRGEQGVAMATFTMDRAGRVLAASLVRSSGSPTLDEEAVALIRRAGPLPPMPAEMPGATVTLTVPVTFALR